VDGLVVIGGGLAGAARFFLPALIRELNGTFAAGRERIPRLELHAFDLTDPAGRALFLRGEAREIPVPGPGRTVRYGPMKRTGVGLTRLGTSRAVAIGAWAFALSRLKGEAR